MEGIKQKIKRWADGKAKAILWQMEKNFNDPDKAFDNLYMNGYHAAMMDLIEFLDRDDGETDTD